MIISRPLTQISNIHCWGPTYSFIIFMEDPPLFYLPSRWHPNCILLFLHVFHQHVNCTLWCPPHLIDVGRGGLTLGVGFQLLRMNRLTLASGCYLGQEACFWWLTHHAFRNMAQSALFREVRLDLHRYHGLHNHFGRRAFLVVIRVHRLIGSTVSRTVCLHVWCHVFAALARVILLRIIYCSPQVVGHTSVLLPLVISQWRQPVQSFHRWTITRINLGCQGIILLLVRTPHHRINSWPWIIAQNIFPWPSTILMRDSVVVIAILVNTNVGVISVISSIIPIWTIIIPTWL